MHGAQRKTYLLFVQGARILDISLISGPHFMYMLTSFVIAASAAISAAPAMSANFTVLCDNSGEEVAPKSCNIKLSGAIEKGDAQKLLRIVRTPQQPGGSYGSLVLDSPGGSIAAALELSAAVRNTLLYTATGRLTPVGVETYRCVSACFLVWVAGAQRISTAFLMPRRADGTSEIGLHRPYFEREAYERSPNEVAARQQQATRLTSEYLMNEQVPQELIEKMLSRASTQVYWVGPEDVNISGMSPWFEEMMIARCGFDPTRTEEAARYAVERKVKRWAATGSLEIADPAGKDLREQQDEELSRRYFACQQAVQVSTQRALSR